MNKPCLLLLRILDPNRARYLTLLQFKVLPCMTGEHSINLAHRYDPSAAERRSCGRPPSREVETPHKAQRDINVPQAVRRRQHVPRADQRAGAPAVRELRLQLTFRTQSTRIRI